MQRIAVIGAGVIGLTTAVRLQDELGPFVKVTIYTRELSPNTTGDVAAGLWYPYLLMNTPAENVVKWSKDTQAFFLQLWKDGYASEAGVSLQSMLQVTPDDFVMPFWSDIIIGYHPLSKEQLSLYQKEHNAAYTGGYTFLAFVCEPSKLLPFLQQKFIKNGGCIEIKSIENIEELKEYDFVVNCSGLNSKILMRDEKVIPIRGQIARIVAPWQFHTVLDDSDDGNYIIPNMDCVILGGTHQEGNENLQPCESDAEMIISGCCKMVPSLKKAKLIKNMVGLRPGREEVRLEMETKYADGKLMKIIHNYGHGGSGVTLCYGCAGDVVDLVKKALNLKQRSKL